MEHYRAIFQASPDGILLVGPDGVIREVNEHAVELFGWTREELEGMIVERLVPSAAHERHRKHREDYARDPQPRPMGIGLELRARRKDGTEFPVEVSLAGLATNGGESLVVATVRDVTERIRLRDFGKAALRATEDERHRIARELHDDTSQHLAAILIRLRLAQNGADPATSEALEEIRESLTNASESIRRIARALRPPELEDAGLGAAIRAHARAVRDGSRLDVRLELEGAGAPLDADAQLVLYRVVQEAMNNAVRHGEPSELGVRIEGAGRHVVATVWDDGRGFDVEAERRSGAGLGLMGMLERAASVGGHVDLESDPGKGTRVTLHLPMPDRGDAPHG